MKLNFNFEKNWIQTLLALKEKNWEKFINRNHIEINKLIPSVATGKQFNSALGNPQKIFQRIMISAIGGVITLLISQSQVTSQFYSLWLVLGVIFLLYIYRLFYPLQL